jgi:hypothetical protein
MFPERFYGPVGNRSDQGLPSPVGDAMYREKDLLRTVLVTA